MSDVQTNTIAAPQARQINLEIHQKSGKPFVAITGRTFTIRKVLWVMGGEWSKEQKVHLVPAHKAVEAQELANRVTATIEATMAVAKAKREALGLPEPVRTPKVAETAEQRQARRDEKRAANKAAFAAKRREANEEAPVIEAELEQPPF